MYILCSQQRVAETTYIAASILLFLFLQDKYKDLHPRLPVIVAETLLYTDPEIELPLWLVQMFKVVFS
jgi:hypothetical protein